MQRYFDFSRLIRKYSSDFVALTLSEGWYSDSGVWINGDVIKTTLTGAIINHRESKILRSEGTLGAKDKALYMLKPIDDKLQGAKVIHDDNVYSISDCLENAKFTGVYAYTLKYISAFKDFAPDYDLTAALERLEKRLDGVLVDTMPHRPHRSVAKQSERLEKRLDGVLIDKEVISTDR